MHYTSPQQHIDGQNPTANPPETEPAVKPPKQKNKRGQFSARKQRPAMATARPPKRL